MMDEELLKALRLVGWGLVGQKLGLPITQILQDVREMVDGLARENASLSQELSHLSLEVAGLRDANLNLRTGLKEKQEVVCQLQQENAELERRLQKEEGPKPLQLATSIGSAKGACSASTASQWLEALPDFPRCVILGAPGTGKSATGHFLLGLCRWKARPYILGFPEDKERLLPQWIGFAASFEGVPQGSIILVDEAYLLYHARTSSFAEGPLQISRALGLARQREHSILCVAHEARHLDRNIVGYANMLVIKEPGPVDMQFERPELRGIIEKAKGFFEVVLGDRKPWSYVWSPEADFEGPLETPLPSYWTEDLSRAYAGETSPSAERPPHITKEERKAQARTWREQEGLSYGQIAKRLGVSKATVVNWLRHGR